MVHVSRLTVTIDDAPVRVVIDRVSVAEYDALEQLATPRGSAVDPETRDRRQWDRVMAIDRYMAAEPGEVTLDGEPKKRLGIVVGGRADLVDKLYQTLLDAQLLTARERQDLEIATRFSAWLVDAARKKVASKWLETGTSCERCRQAKLCTQRGCDGSAQKRPVWNDKKFILKTCPVLSLTPDIERAQRLFYWTHKYSGEGWQQQALPADGGVPEQEAWMLAAMSELRRVHNELMVEHHKTGGADHV